MENYYIPYGSNAKLDKILDESQPYSEDRIILANEGYALNKLANDPDFKVRKEVANWFYGLDRLIDDSNSMVRETAIRNLCLQERIKQSISYPDSTKSRHNNSSIN